MNIPCFSANKLSKKSQVMIIYRVKKGIGKVHTLFNEENIHPKVFQGKRS